MKKIKLLFIMLLSISLVACSLNNDADKEKEEKEETVAVDKGLLNVEITLPASLFEGEKIDEIIEESKENGVKEVSQNEDGSITYKMSRAEHKKIMTDMGENIQEFIGQLETGEDYPSIKSVEYNKSFTEFTLVVNQSEYENSFEGIATVALAAQAMYYQLFDGVDVKDYQVTMHLQNEETSEVFDTIVYPEAFAEAESEE